MMENNIDHNSEIQTPKQPSQSVRIVSLLLFLGVIIFGGLTLWQSQQDQPQAPYSLYSDKTYSQDEIEAIVAKVQARIDLPDEVPLIAEVHNAQALKADQPFYQNVANGDLVLLYPTKAVVYRPGDDIIINAGPLLYVDPSKLGE